jgi:hypothetical protein
MWALLRASARADARCARRFIAQLGLVTAEAQRSELGLDKAPEAPAEASAGTAAAAAAPAEAKKEL